MPTYWIEMAKIESALIYLTKSGVKHVALSMKEAIDVSLGAETSEENVRKEFQGEIC